MLLTSHVKFSVLTLYHNIRTNFYLSFLFTIDASRYVVSGILSQEAIGKYLFITYTSRLSNAVEKNYSIGKECLVIIYCFDHFRPYFFRRRFMIITDYKPLI